MAYRNSELSDDAYSKEERWNCDRCHTDKVIVKEIPIPKEKTMLVDLLMSLSEKYELQGTRISVSYREVKATSIVRANPITNKGEGVLSHANLGLLS
jgi:hypothetical protein